MANNEQPPLERIEDYLDDLWVETWAEKGAREAEEFLGQVIDERVGRRARLEAFNVWLVDNGLEPDTIDELEFGAIPGPRPAIAKAAIKAAFEAEDYGVNSTDLTKHRPAADLLGPN